MTIRRSLKRWLYGSCPGFAGRFPYFGTQVYFPKGSHSFLAACEQGIFESDNVRLLQGLVRPGSWMFDVGANIGLMSIPILLNRSDVHVVAFEPSPNTLPWLRRTIDRSALRDRWTLVPRAVGAETKRVSFSVSAIEESLYDGIRATGRVGQARTVEVEQTTLDETWRALGSPDVSMIKCDVEGGELAVFQGARQCLGASRPAVLTEFNRLNLAAYEISAETLLGFIKEVEYRIYALPGLAEVRRPRELEVQMIFTESFLLLPSELR
ncbi:MAG: FkbM family methyltransferase [Thermoanaerobaculia bacterium]